MHPDTVLHGESQLVAGTEFPDGINLILTDPPYGVAYQSNFARTPIGKSYNEEIANDGDPAGAIDLFLDVMNILTPKTVDDCDAYVFTSWTVYSMWEAALAQHLPDWKLKMLLVWQKNYPGLGDLEGNWGCGHELILYLKKGRRPINGRRTGVLTFDRLPSGTNIHETEKPVGLLEVLIKASTEPGDIVVDPFAGSGSTVYAAQRTGRVGYGIEKNEKYISAANSRLDTGSFGW